VSVTPGWYADPADPTTQRYWDGEGYVGDPLPIDATPPPGPPKVKPGAAGAAAHPTVYPGGRPVTSAPPAAPPGVVGGAGGSGGPGVGSPLGGSGQAPGGGQPWQPGAGQQWPPGAGQPWPPGRPVPPPGWPPGFPLPASAYPPAPRPHGFPLALPGRRFWARIVDIVIVLLLNVVANGYLAYRLYQDMAPTVRQAWQNAKDGQNYTGPPPPDETTWILFAILIIGLAVWFAYEVPATANRGQTFGKWLFGIKVVRLESTQPMGFARSFRRWRGMAMPTLFWPCCLIGMVLQFIDSLFVLIDKPLSQAIHDKTSLTVVVKVRGETPTPGKPSVTTSKGASS
jgi:uncharacterized RDD family membrane protein YckC